METTVKNSIASSIAGHFRQRFHAEPLLVRSPGRINLIGEHTDYNNGFVLPAAINKAIYIAAAPSGDDSCHYIAYDMQEYYQSNLKNLQKIEGHWSVYINSVVDQLKKGGYAIGGFNCVIGGDIPTGAGMSSSAAVECATLFALNELFDLGLDTMSMVKMAQKAENQYVGVQCGIMDQFASMFGKTGHVIKLDCRSLEFEYAPFNMDGIKIVLFDTNIKHSLASSEYNTRRLQCEAGIALIQRSEPGIKSLRDVTIEMLDQYVLPEDQLTYDRCRYVVDEIQRLQDAFTDLENHDMEAFGKKMFATHDGLTRLYDVSCKELDFLVDLVKDNPAVSGARMMGGGFGGCTINLVKEEAIARLVDDISIAYKKQFGIDCNHYIVSVENGTERIEG